MLRGCRGYGEAELGFPKSGASVDIPLSGIFNIDVVTPLVLVTSGLGPA
jgi:hypothetical protein